MIVACITDRIGNQMFQYASAKGIAVKNGTGLKLDKRYYNHKTPEASYFYQLDVFNINESFVTDEEIRTYTGLSNSLFHKVIRRIDKNHQKGNKNYIYNERFFGYDEEVFNAGNNIYLRGYWQSYKYFSHCEDIIRDSFRFRNPIDLFADEFARDIMNSNSVCISVRRGDHFWHPETSAKFGRCSIEYYEKALEIISQNQSNLKLFVFSDEIEWCEQNLKFSYPTIFVKRVMSIQRFDYFLQLITLCKHFVIPVSTFPWWGAWLSVSKEKIVIAPKNWLNDASVNTNDLCPPDWIRL